MESILFYSWATDFSSYELLDLFFSFCNLGATVGFIYFTVQAIESTEKASKDSILASKISSDISVRASQEAVLAAQKENTFQVYFEMTTHWIDQLNVLSSNHYPNYPEFKGRRLLINFHDDVLKIPYMQLDNYDVLLSGEIDGEKYQEWFDDIRKAPDLSSKIKKYYEANDSELGTFLNFFKYVLIEAKQNLTNERYAQLVAFIRSQMTRREVNLAHLLAIHLFSESELKSSMEIFGANDLHTGTTPT